MSLSGVEQWNRAGLSGVKQLNRTSQKRSQLLANSKPNFVSFSLRDEATKPLDMKKKEVLAALDALQYFLLSSPDAWEGAILFSDVFIHGSDILNNLCVPAELQTKLICYHIPYV